MDRKYEISLWEDITGPIADEAPLDRKICVIGSDTMTSQIQALEPKLVNNINGTNTFSFKMYRTYKDEITGENIVNPFLLLLINERKVKVLWKDQWYDFVVKNIVENSADNSIVYTCQDLFINELSRNGYNLEFTSELQNNTGTLEELAGIVLEGSSWEFDINNTDKVYQQMEDAVYEATLSYDLINPKGVLQDEEEATLQDENYTISTVTIPANSKILVFKSEIDKIVDDFNNTKSTSPKQFTIQFIGSNNYTHKENSLLVEENNCYIKDFAVEPVWGNEQLISLKFFDLEFDYDNVTGFNGNFSIIINDVSTNYRGLRYVSSQVSVYDKDLDRFVNVYDGGVYYKIQISDDSTVYLTIKGYGKIARKNSPLDDVQTNTFYLSKTDINSLNIQWDSLEADSNNYKLENISLITIDNDQQKFLNYQFNFKKITNENEETIIEIYTNEYPDSAQDGTVSNYTIQQIASLKLDSDSEEWEGIINSAVTPAESITAKVYGYSNTEFDDPMQITNLIVNPTNYKNVAGWTGDCVGGIQIYPKFNQIRNIQDVKSYLKVLPGNGATVNSEVDDSWTPLLKNALFRSNQSYFKPTQLDIRRGDMGGIKAGDKYVFRAKVALGSKRGDYLTAIDEDGKYVFIICGNELYHGAVSGSIVGCPFIYDQVECTISSTNISARVNKGNDQLQEVGQGVTKITVGNNINFFTYFCENSNKQYVCVNNYPFKIGEETYYADFKVIPKVLTISGVPQYSSFKRAIIKGSQQIEDDPEEEEAGLQGEEEKPIYAWLEFEQIYGWNQSGSPIHTQNGLSSFDETPLPDTANPLKFSVVVQDFGLLTLEKRFIDEKEIYGLYDGDKRVLLIVNNQTTAEGYNSNQIIPIQIDSEDNNSAEQSSDEPGSGEQVEPEHTTAEILDEDYHVTLFTAEDNNIYTLKYSYANGNYVNERYPITLRFENSESNNFIIYRRPSSDSNGNDFNPSKLNIVSDTNFTCFLYDPQYPNEVQSINVSQAQSGFYIASTQLLSDVSLTSHKIVKPEIIDNNTNFEDEAIPEFESDGSPTAQTFIKWWKIVTGDENFTLQGINRNLRSITSNIDLEQEQITNNTNILLQTNNEDTLIPIYRKAPDDTSQPFGDLIEVTVKKSFISETEKTIPKGAVIYLSAWDLDYYGKVYRNWHQGLNGGYTSLIHTYTTDVSISNPNGITHQVDGCIRFKYQDSYDRTIPLMFYDESYDSLDKDDWIHFGDLSEQKDTMIWVEYFALKFIHPKRIKNDRRRVGPEFFYADSDQTIFLGMGSFAYITVKKLKYLEDSGILDRTRTEFQATGYNIDIDLKNDWDRVLAEPFVLQFTIDNGNTIYERTVDNYFFDKMGQVYVCKFDATPKEQKVWKLPKYLLFSLPTFNIDYDEYVAAAKAYGTWAWNNSINAPSYVLYPYGWDLSEEDSLNPEYRLFNSSNNINDTDLNTDLGLISFTSNDDEIFPSNVYANFLQGLSLIPEVIQTDSLNPSLNTNIIEVINSYDAPTTNNQDSSNYLLPQHWQYDPNTGYNTCVVSFTTDVSASEVQELQFQLKNYFSNVVFVEDVQFFKYILDEEGNIIYPGQYGKQSIQNTIYHFYEPNQNVLPEEMKFLYQGKNSCTETYIPMTWYKKLATIEAKGSNRFNIIQEIGEKFGRWPRFIIGHNNNGSILFGTKKIAFVEQVGKELGWSFEYGIDLKTVRRTLASNNIVTKTLVLPNSNEFGKDGFCSIARSELNFARENFILNFDYYTKIGLIDQQTLMQDLYSTNGYYYKLNKFNTEYDKNTEELRKYNMDLVKFSSQMTVLQAQQNATIQEITSLKSNMISLANIASGTIDVPELTWQKAYDYLSSHTGDAKIEALLNSYVITNRTKANIDEEIKTLTKSINDLNDIIQAYNTRQQILFKNINDCHQDFFNKYSQYIFEGTWQDQNYIDDDKYYLDALEVSAESAFPKLTYEISVMRVSDLEDFKSKVFNVGDSCSIIDRDFFGYTSDKITPYKLPIVITEITSYLNQPEKDVIKVQNYLNSFDDLFQRITATTQSLQYRQGSFERAASIVNYEKTIDFTAIQQSFDDNEDLVLNSSNQAVTWDSTGLTVTDNSNAALKLKLIAGGLFLTNDGGATWKNAIRGDGISADVLTAGRINTNEIYLYDGNNPLFRWDNRGLTAYAKDYTAYAINRDGTIIENSNGTYYQENSNKFNKFIRFDSFGIYGYEGSEDFYPLYEDMIWDNNDVKFGLTWKGFFLRGGKTVTTTVTDENNQETTIQNNTKLEIVGEENNVKFSLMNGDAENGIEISTENDIVVRRENTEVVKIGKLSDELGYGLQIKDVQGGNVFTVTTEGGNFSDLGGWVIDSDGLYKNGIRIDSREGKIIGYTDSGGSTTNNVIINSTGITGTIMGQSTIDFGGISIKYNEPGIIKLNNSKSFSNAYGYISAEFIDLNNNNTELSTKVLKIGLKQVSQSDNQPDSEYTANAEVNILDIFRVTADGDVQVKKNNSWKNVQTSS